jgi:hypothetical protein
LAHRSPKAAAAAVAPAEPAGLEPAAVPEQEQVQERVQVGPQPEQVGLRPAQVGPQPA